MTQLEQTFSASLAEGAVSRPGLRRSDALPAAAVAAAR